MENSRNNMQPKLGHLVVCEPIWSASEAAISGWLHVTPKFLQYVMKYCGCILLYYDQRMLVEARY